MRKKKNTKAKVGALLIILLSFAVSIYFYPQLPEKIASHWNVQGETDGCMPKLLGLFLMPLIILGIFFLSLLIPRIDPLKKNIEKFKGYFNGLIIFLLLFFLYIHLLIILWNLDLEIGLNIVSLMVPAFGILFYYTGVVMEKSKRNWSIGIRTPWTLSSDKVWEKTHEVGGKLFKVAALITLCGLFFKEFAILFIIIPVVFVAIYSIIYSYFVYKKEVKK